MLLQQAGSAEEKVTEKTFEEVIGELDEEINKYDSKGSVAIRVDANTEKENVGDQHTINEASMPCSPSYATNITTKKHAMLTKSCNQYVLSSKSTFGRDTMLSCQARVHRRGLEKD